MQNLVLNRFHTGFWLHDQILTMYLATFDRLAFLICSLHTPVDTMIKQHYLFCRLNIHKRKEENKKTEMKVNI